MTSTFWFSGLLLPTERTERGVNAVQTTALFWNPSSTSFSGRLVNFLHMIRHIRPLRPSPLSQATHSTVLNQTKGLAGGKRCLKTDIKNSISSPSWQKPGFFPHDTGVTIEDTLSIHWTNRLQQERKKDSPGNSSIFLFDFDDLLLLPEPFVWHFFASKVFSAPKSQCKYKDVPFQKWKTTPASLRNHSKCSQPHSETFYL